MREGSSTSSMFKTTSAYTEHSTLAATRQQLLFEISWLMG
jgi:hypothetical protein